MTQATASGFGHMPGALVCLQKSCKPQERLAGKRTSPEEAPVTGSVLIEDRQ